jgi:hypothetical protein
MVAFFDMTVGQNSGNKIEHVLIREVNGKRFGEINVRVQQMLLEVDSSVADGDAIFRAYKAGGSGINRKVDLIFEFGNERIASPSVKSGGGNSVHQENIHDFVNFLRDLGVDEATISELYWFHWGDGTTDGSGAVSQRISSREIRARFPDTIRVVGEMFDKHQKSIVARALAGSQQNSSPSHLLYTENEQLSNLTIIPMSEVIEFNSHPQTDSDLTVGRLQFQNYGRCLQGQDLISNKTRNDVQFKWPTLAADVRDIYRSVNE